MPKDHSLPSYFHLEPLRDRFLPLLARHLPPNSTAVDVGANVGDTLAAIVSENELVNYICIEGDEEFSEYLESNVALILSTNPALKISVVNALVGQGLAGKLEGNHGTKSLTEQAFGPLEAQSLDKILADNSAKNVSLVKVDTDGFDLNVLFSAAQTIETHQPILFFEVYLKDIAAVEHYSTLVKRLFGAGYKNWSFFDNFGNLICRDVVIEQAVQLFNYLWMQDQGKSPRTFTNYDVVTSSTDSSEEIVELAFADYNLGVE